MILSPSKIKRIEEAVEIHVLRSNQIILGEKPQEDYAANAETILRLCSYIEDLLTEIKKQREK